MKKSPVVNIGVVASIAFVVLATFFMYFESFRWLYSQWSTDDSYSHGFFIPFVSLYLIWCKRELITSFSLKPSNLGYLAVVFCLLLLLIGRTGAVVQIEALSFFLMIPSCILLICGWQHLKTLFLPILYLQFMIPWMGPILEKMYEPFQIVSAVIATALLKLKYPVYTDSLTIHLPKHITMVVAHECSGISFLVSVIALGIPLVYLSQKTWFRAIVVVIIGCILTVLSNGLRIAIAGYMGQNYGPELLHGPAHIFQGWFVTWFGWISLFVVNWLFGKIPYKNGEPKYHLYERWRSNTIHSRTITGTNFSFRFHYLSLLVLFFCFAIYLNHFAMPRAIPPSAPLQQFPLEFGEWKGENSDWAGGSKYFPRLDDELSRIYRDKSGNSVYLFIGYYQRQDNDKRLISYHSSSLHANGETQSLSGNSSFQVVLSSLPGDLHTLTSFFWYQFPDNLIMTDRMQVKLHVLHSSLMRRENNGAIILLAAPEQDKENFPELTTKLKSFALYLVPAVNEIFK